MGTRNYIAVVAASNCAAHTAELIARSYEGVESAAQCRWCGVFPARRGLRACLRPRCGSAAAHARRCSGAPQRLGCAHPRPGLRGQPDRSLPGPRQPAHQPAGGHDAAGERRHYGNAGSGAARNRPVLRTGRRGSAGSLPRFQNRAGPELRRVGFLLRHHRQPRPRLSAPTCSRSWAARLSWPRLPRSSAPSTCWSAARATAKSPRNCWAAFAGTRNISPASKAASTTIHRPATKKAD